MSFLIVLPKYYIIENLYIATIKTFAQILSKINAARRGRPEELEAYAEQIRQKMLGTNFDDKFGRV